MRNHFRFALLVLAFATAALAPASCGSVDSGSGGNDTQGMNHGEKEDAQGGKAGPKKANGGMAEMDHGPTDKDAAGMVAENGEYSDKAFIDAMIPHHQGAVEMAEVALNKAEHRQLKDLADNVVTTQKAEIESLRSIRQEEFGTTEAPEKMSPEGMETMGMTDPGRLAGQRPFDRAFIDAMIPHHESATEMAEAARKGTDNPEIREIAGDIVDAQKQEISQMERWREEWYPRG